MRRSIRSFARQRLHPAQRYGLRLTLFAVAVVLVAIPFSLLAEQVVTGGRITELDLIVLGDVHALVASRSWLSYGFSGISILGNVAFLGAVVAGVCLVLWFRRLHRLVAYLAVTATVGGLITGAVKVVVARPRPALDGPVASGLGGGFPSGHTTLSTIVYGSLLLAFLPLIHERWRRVTIGGVCILVLLIGCSRLALGVHFVTDVVGGLVVGTAWLTAATAAFTLWRVDRGESRLHPLRDGVEPEEASELLVDPERPATGPR